MSNYVQPGFPDPPRVDRNGFVLGTVAPHQPPLTDIQRYRLGLASEPPASEPIVPGSYNIQPGTLGNPMNLPATIPRYQQPVADSDDPHHVFH